MLGTEYLPIGIYYDIIPVSKWDMYVYIIIINQSISIIQNASSYIAGNICLFHYISFPSRKQFEGAAFLSGTSPKFTTDLSNIMEHLSLVLKIKFPEKIHAFQTKLK